MKSACHRIIRLCSKYAVSDGFTFDYVKEQIEDYIQPKRNQSRQPYYSQ